MTHDHHEIRFAVNIIPSVQRAREVVRLARYADDAGLDLVTFQDHPQNPGLLDTWTLLSYVAAHTTRIRLAGNVHPIALRPPAILARAAASLDVLTGGRIELGLGTGGFSEAVGAMGGPALSAGELVDGLDEALDVIRALWRVDHPEPAVVDGRHHRLNGAPRGPRPAHDIGIWLGAYRPRMLALTGRAADGWWPSLPSLEPGQLAAGNAAVDRAARTAGRNPGEIRRILNTFDTISTERFVDLALADRIDTFVVLSEDTHVVRHLAEVIAPAVREQVAGARRVS